MGEAWIWSARLEKTVAKRPGERIRQWQRHHTLQRIGRKETDDPVSTAAQNVAVVDSKTQRTRCLQVDAFVNDAADVEPDKQT